MPASIGSSLSFDGNVLPAVALVQPDLGVTMLDETGIGQASAEFDAGVFEGDVRVTLYFRPANHNLILAALAGRTVKACVVTFATSQTATGNVRVASVSVAVAVKASLAMEVVLKCTGAWTIAATSTGA